MKKLLLLSLLFFLSACSPKIITEINGEDLKQILVTAGEHEYKIKDDKIEIVFSNFEEEYTSKEQAKTVDDNYKIILQTDTLEEIYYVEEEGTIVKEENNKYYRYSFELPKVYNQFKDLVGYDIYYGKYLLNENYIENIDGEIFNIDGNEVEGIILSTGLKLDYVLIKEDKINEFIEVMNSIEYYEKQEGGLFGDAPVIYILLKDDYMGMIYVPFPKFPMLDLNDYEIENNSSKAHTYYLKNDNLSDLLFEIMGEKAFNMDNYDNYKPQISSDWVEKVMTNEENNKYLCDRYHSSWCKY